LPLGLDQDSDRADRPASLVADARARLVAPVGPPPPDLPDDGVPSFIPELTTPQAPVDPGDETDERSWHDEPTLPAVPGYPGYPDKADKIG
jgi:hypothetical protein